MPLRVHHAGRGAFPFLISNHLLTKEQSYNDDKDVTLVAGYADRPVGCLVLRPMYYAHSFNLHPDRILPDRAVADALFRYADGFCSFARESARPGEFAPHGTLFHVHRDNAKMKGFIESKGAICEPDSLLYRYDLIT